MEIKWTVAVYEINRQYGGPEEGGWWFDCGELQSNHPIQGFETFAEAREALTKWDDELERVNKEEGRRHPSSVLCSGWLQAHIHEGLPPKYFPPKRPHYE
jgi:hypothetical protein